MAVCRGAGGSAFAAGAGVPAAWHAALTARVAISAFPSPIPIRPPPRVSPHAPELGPARWAWDTQRRAEQPTRDGRTAKGAGGRRTRPGDREAVTPRHHAGCPGGAQVPEQPGALNRGRLEREVGSEPPGRPCGPHGRPTVCPAVPLGQAEVPVLGRALCFVAVQAQSRSAVPCWLGVPGLGLVSPVLATQAFSELLFKVTISSCQKGLCILVT